MIQNELRKMLFVSWTCSTCGSHHEFDENCCRYCEDRRRKELEREKRLARAQSGGPDAMTGDPWPTDSR